METYMVSWIPIFVLLFIILPQQYAARGAAALKIRRKERHMMTNELIQKYIGKYCFISNGTLGEKVHGKIVDVNNNWIEVETKKGNVIINLDYIQNIKTRI